MAASLLTIPDTALHIASKRIERGPLARVVDPWSGALVGALVQAGPSEASDAADASVRAFEEMRALPSYARKKILSAISRGLVERRDDFADLIAKEAGKPKALAKAEVDRAIVTFGLAAEESTRVGGEVMPLDISEASARYSGEWVRVPAGPVLGICPFNFPLNLVAHKVAPALAAGCSVVIKPAPQAPLTALALAQIARDAGGPENAVQVVPCDNAVAEQLVQDERFRVLSFTGSAKVGWRLKSIAGKKRVLLELGGNAAVIVHEDSPMLASAAALVCASAFNYAGQVCIKTQRLYVHRPIADRLIEEVVERARGYVPEDPLTGTVAIGPMIDEAAAIRVESWIEEARASGARLLVGGKREKNRLPAHVLQIEGDGRGLKVVDEEVFGPVLTVHVCDTWSEALRMADTSRYGLQAGVFTDSQSRIREAFRELHVGGLIVNDVPSVRIDAMPYGGTRESGLGREGVRFAIEEMTERKVMVVRG